MNGETPARMTPPPLNTPSCFKAKRRPHWPHAVEYAMPKAGGATDKPRYYHQGPDKPRTKYAMA